MSDVTFVMLIGAVTLAVIFLFGAAVYFFVSKHRLRSIPAMHSQSDLTNMMILFQTMRDILGQQKDLAREFNISIDKKVEEVRSLIKSTGDVRGDLDRAKREIALLSTQTRSQLSALERRLSNVDNNVADGSVDAGVQTAPEPEASTALETPPDESDQAPDAESAEAAAAVADPVESPETAEEPTAVEDLLEVVDDPTPSEIRDVIAGPGTETVQGAMDEQWTGMDFGDDDEELEFDEPEFDGSSEEAQEDVAQTREAFRNLLNFPADTPEMTLVPSSADILNADGNGGQYLTPIQKRVYEYSDAGMRVPEIARELGVGKGEVRLILSLRQNRTA